MNKKIICVLLLFIVLMAPTTEGQTLKLGFRVEPTLMFVKNVSKSEFWFSPYGTYLAVQFEPFEWLNFEIRPGYLMAGEDYFGSELGANFKVRILQPNWFVVAGVNSHSNLSSGHNSGGSYSKQILYKGLGIGYQKDSHLSFDITYYWTDDKDFAYSRITDWLTYSRIAKIQMNGIVQIGFCFTWDVL